MIKNNLKNLLPAQAVNLIRGKAGTFFKILIMRKDFKSRREFAIKRLPVIKASMFILSAAEGSQISASSSEKGHGLFTYYF